jgi:hypothetical protein
MRSIITADQNFSIRLGVDYCFQKGDKSMVAPADENTAPCSSARQSSRSPNNSHPAPVTTAIQCPDVVVTMTHQPSTPPPLDRCVPVRNSSKDSPISHHHCRAEPVRN